MNEQTLNDFKRHAEAEFPKEACGLVMLVNGEEVFRRCQNVAYDPTKGFEISGEELAQAEGEGEVLAICHTHPNASPLPSDADRRMCEETALPWHIMSWPGGAMFDLQPSGWVAPLIGRNFYHGVLDCWALVRDYYDQVLSIKLPDFPRKDNWWARPGDENPYLKYMDDAGFVQVPISDLREHDGILMQVGARVPNHGAVYADASRNWMIHHLYNRMSVREVYTDSWRRITRGVYRHKSLL